MMQHDVRFHIQYGTTTNRLDAIPLTTSLVIGRALSADVVVQDPMSSRQHVRFFIRDGFGWVEDLNSSNGSFLNGRRLLEATRIADGDVLSIGQTSFYVTEDSSEIPSLQWTKTIDSVLEEIKDSVQGQSVSRIHSTLLLQERSRTFDQLCSQLLELVRANFPVHLVELWMAPSQRFVDLAIFGQVDSKIKDSSLEHIDSGVQQLVWNEHHIVCQQVGEQSGVWAKAHIAKVQLWRTIMPIVWRTKRLGVLILTSDVEPRTFIHDLTLTLHWYTKEWSILESWHKEPLSQPPLMTSMQWMLANETAGLDLEIFKQRHEILRSVLRFLIQDLGWSAHEIHTAESVMVLVDAGLDSPELNEKIRWYEQSSDPLIDLLVRLTRGVQGRGTVNTPVRIIRLCMDLVDVCLTDPFAPSEEVFSRLLKDHDLKDCSFSTSDLFTVFQLVQQLDQQDQETQLFGR